MTAAMVRPRPPDPGNRRRHASAGSHILDTPADARRCTIPAGLGRHPPTASLGGRRLRNRESVRRATSPAEIGMPKLKEPTDTRSGAGQPDVIGGWGNMRLMRYQARGPRRQPVPVLIVSPLLAKPYVLDLAPALSLVDHLVERGLELFLLDFGIPDGRDRHLRRHVTNSTDRKAAGSPALGGVEPAYRSVRRPAAGSSSSRMAEYTGA